MIEKVKINGRRVNVYFGYRMSQDEFFSNWEDMVRYWKPYYQNRVELLEKARPEVVVETEGGFPLNAKMTRRPYTAAEKRAFIQESVVLRNGLYTIEKV